MRSSSCCCGLLAVLVVFGVIAAGCGGEDSGDQEAFCELLRDGVGVGSDEAEIDPADFEQLEEVAPPDIRGVVKKLANTARSLDEIPDEDLDELFAAAFDPDAVAAREELVGYATAGCGIDPDALQGGRVGTEDVLSAELESYLEANFASEPWLDDIAATIVRDGAALDSVRVEFDRRTSRGEAIDVCNAVAVWLYAIKNASGSVIVLYEGESVAGRVGREASCDQ